MERLAVRTDKCVIKIQEHAVLRQFVKITGAEALLIRRVLEQLLIAHAHQQLRFAGKINAGHHQIAVLTTIVPQAKYA